jgi:hypothetical protein
MFSEGVLLDLVNSVRTKLDNKMLASFRSSDEHDLDPAAWSGAHIESKGWPPRRSRWGRHAFAATVIGSVN